MSKIKTITNYQITVNGSYSLSKDSYSKYSDRYELYLTDYLSYEEVYGLEQCIEHIAEYLGRRNVCQKQRQTERLVIEKVITNIEEIDYDPIPPIPNIIKNGRVTIISNED